MMHIALHDADKEHLKRKSFPNYALMKVAAWYKSRGDAVEWWEPLKKYNLVYSSKIFDFTKNNPYLPENTVRGGTGYPDIPIEHTLPPEMDSMFPDYSIYPACDYAVGYLTRGCPNKCRWCAVPKKEGNIRAYRDWQEVVRLDSKKLVLMDNNILAIDHGIKQLESMIGSGYKIDLNQGMDARLVTPEIADILSKLEWTRFIRFSCDQKSQIEPIRKVCNMLQERGKRPYNVFIYLLVTSDLDDAACRVEAIKSFPGINIYAQAERNSSMGIFPNKLQLEFAQRYIYGGFYRTHTWNQYLKRWKQDA